MKLGKAMADLVALMLAGGLTFALHTKRVERAFVPPFGALHRLSDKPIIIPEGG